VKSCKDKITGIISQKTIQAPEDIRRITSFLHTLHVFEVELFALLQDWSQLMRTITDAVESDPSAVNTFEAIADIVWVARDCPVEVSFAALEAILHASLDQNSLSIEKFSRWLRAICTICLARNSASDRSKAVGYVEQAVTVINDYSEVQDDLSKVYPMDERQWLLATSYNTGLECLQSVPPFYNLDLLRYVYRTEQEF